MSQQDQSRLSIASMTQPRIDEPARARLRADAAAQWRQRWVQRIMPYLYLAPALIAIAIFV